MVSMSIQVKKDSFILIEFLVAMAIIAIMLSLVAPRYFGSVPKAEEATLKEDLMLMRESINKYHADTGRYPDTLDDLVNKKYLRNIPVDPVTQSSSSWIIISPANLEKGAVVDIKRGTIGNTKDGTAYDDW
jgi:general secretion pathway protein G